MGSITSIPEGHQTSAILSSLPIRGPDGIRKAFSSWGAKLQKWYGTNRPAHDVTLEYLQYSTDNGGFYHYNTEPNQTYQETIIEVKEHASKAGIPFKNWLMDSWWYYKSSHGKGVINWTAMPEVFPQGIRYVRDHTGWDIVAHNRYWSSETDYAKQNGGNYDFVVEKHMALPLEERFWDDLMEEGKLWGLVVYEQDWMDVQTQGTNFLLENIEAGRTWLVQMGNAAKKRGIHIQYCMEWPRHLLQSLEIDAVTQARGSWDYQPNLDQWFPLGVTSMFTFALGIAPLKDNFWSSDQHEPGNPKYDPDREEASRLHAIVATYSTGSVSPSDQFRFLNKELLLRSCAEDGRILRPDKPAVRTDASIFAAAGIPVPPDRYDVGQKDQVWSTLSVLSGYSYTYLLAANSPSSFVLTEKSLYPSPSLLHNRRGDAGGSQHTDEHILWELDAPFAPTGLPYTVPISNRTNVHVYCIAPVFPNGWSFLGEAETKWTAVSGDRFSELVVDSDGFSVSVAGAPSEVVQLVVRSPEGDFRFVGCTLSSRGVAKFRSDRMECSETTRAERSS